MASTSSTSVNNNGNPTVNLNSAPTVLASSPTHPAGQSSDAAAHHPLSVAPSRNAKSPQQRPAEALENNPSTPSKKRKQPCTPTKQQSLLTSFFPNKKPNIEKLTPKSRAKQIKQIELEEMEADKLVRDALKQQSKEWKQQWDDWVSHNKIKEPRLDLSKGHSREEYWILRDAQSFGLDSHDLKCLPRGELDNPKGADYAKMKLYKIQDVKWLAYRKEAVTNGLSYLDEDSLLRKGQALLENRIPGRR